MTFSFTHADGGQIPLTPGKVVCVGRNYARHAAELGNPVPTTPLLFIKPQTSLVSMSDAPLTLPQGHGPVHHELELALVIGDTLRRADEAQAADAVWGWGVGLDLTLRELQSSLKGKGHPWERAKAFDGACPLSPIHPGALDWGALQLRLTINGQVRQDGQTADMITPTLALVAHISQTFTLLPGDVVLTGTPAGVGPLQSGDHFVCEIVGACRHEGRIA